MKIHEYQAKALFAKAGVAIPQGIVAKTAEEAAAAFKTLGGSIAVVEEGGKPQIYLHMGNLAASGVTLSDAVLKIGKRL